MRLVHIIGSMNPSSGGPCQGIRNLNKVLELMHIQREVVSLDDPDSSFIGLDPFEFHALGPSNNAWQYSSKLLPWLIKNLNRFDIVVINGIWTYHVYAVMKAIKILKKREIARKDNTIKIPRVYIMPHGMLDPYFQKARDRKLKAFRNWIYWNLVEARNVEKAKGLLFTCEEELQLARQTFNWYKPQSEINIGYGGQEAPAFTMEMKAAFLEKCPLLKESAYFLFLSRIHPKKGVDLLINAYVEVFKLRALEKQMDNYPKLVIAGPVTDTNYGKYLQQIILKFPEIQPFIFFPGMLSGDAKWGALYGCDAFVLPSHQENFGIAVVEALACRKPVLISNQINIWKEIIADDAGMVKDDTLEGTIELFRNWTDLTRGKKIEMAQNARNSFEKNFSIVPAARRFVEALNSDLDLHM